MSTGLTFDDAILLNDNVRSESFNVNSANPNKYFKFNVVQGEEYIFTTFASSGDTYGTLYNENKVEIASDDDSGGSRQPLIRYTATYTGIVYFMARAFSASSTINGIQALGYVRILRPGDNFDKAILLNDNERSESFLLNSLNTQKYFKFNVVQGEIYIFTTSSSGNTYGHLYNENQVQIDQNDDSAGNNQPLIRYTATYTGIVYFMVRAYSTTTAINNVQALAHLAVLAPGGTFEDALSLNDNEPSQSVSITPSDSYRYFKFNVVQGKQYSFRTTDPGDTFLYLYNESQVAIGSDYRTGENDQPLILHDATYTGFVYLMVTSLSSGVTINGIQVLGYERTELGHTFNNAILLNDNELSESFIIGGYTRLRYFKINIVEGEQYELRAFNLTNNVNAVSTIYDENRARLNLGSNRIYIATYTGILYFMVSYYSLGSLTLQAKAGLRIPPADTTFDLSTLLNDNEPSESFTVNQDNQGKYFKFNVVKDKHYFFTTLGDQDTHVLLYNRYKDKIIENADGGVGANGAIMYTATYTGIAYFKVQARFFTDAAENVQALAREIVVSTTGYDFETAIEIVPGEPIDIYAFDRSQENYFKFNVEPGFLYTFQIRDSNTGSGATLYDSNKEYIRYRSSGGEENNPLIDYHPSSSTFMYVMVSPFNAGFYKAELTTFEIVERDGDNFSNPIPINVDDTRRDSFYLMAENMYYKANLTVGSTYTVQANPSTNVDFLYQNGTYYNRDNIVYYDIDGLDAYDFTATTPVMYILAYTQRRPAIEGTPFDLIFTDVITTIVKSVQIFPEYPTMKLGSTLQLTAEIFPDTAVDKSVVWKSFNTARATVDENGLVTPLTAGNVTIDVKTNDGNRYDQTYITIGVHEGRGTSDEPYLISTAEDIRKIASVMQDGYYFKQTNDIDMSELGNWKGIGGTSYFNGTYDGDNFKITGLTINTNAARIGLFNDARYATLENIIIENANITGSNYVGALAGSSRSCNITNCHVIGSLTTIQGTSDSVGGLVGSSEADVISYSSSEGKVIGTSKVGGLIGDFYQNGSEMYSCYSTANVTGTGNDVGGLIGNVNTPYEIRNCYATGIVTGVQAVGGLIGRYASHYNSNLRNCFVFGDVYGNNAIGGLVGSVEPISGGYGLISLFDCFVLSSKIQDTTNAIQTRNFGHITATPSGNHFDIFRCYTVDDFEVVTTVSDSITMSNHSASTFERSRTNEVELYQNWDFVRAWEMLPEIFVHPTLISFDRLPPPEPLFPPSSEGTMKSVAMDDLVYAQMYGYDSGGTVG